MFKYALKVDWPGVAANPCDGLDRLPPAVKINPNDEAPFTGHREWTLAETDRFLDFYRDEAQPFLTVSLMLYTGLRISDARKVGQSLEKTIDWRGTNVRCLVFDVSKGAKKRAREGKTKLRAIVPIVPQFAEALKRAPDISPTYLLNEHGNRWKSAKSLDRRMRRWLDAIVDEDGSQPFKDLSSHGLRYTAANWWAKTYRCTPHELMAVFGWLKIEQAMKYTAVRPRGRGGRRGGQIPGGRIMMTPREHTASRAATQPRRGLDRNEVAIYVGITLRTFDQMVSDGRLPQPNDFDGEMVWDLRQLDRASDRLTGQRRSSL